MTKNKKTLLYFFIYVSIIFRLNVIKLLINIRDSRHSH